MSPPAVLALARITIATSGRRMDVALPEDVPLAELLPALLRHAGPGLADAGQEHGGWLLRRADGAPLETARTLGAQQVRDGEVLHLVPRRTEWPELDYDDVAEAVAGGARRYGGAWSGRATRATALTVSGVVFVSALLVGLISGPPWFLPGLVSLVFGSFMLVAGMVCSRALADSVAGAVVGGVGLLYLSAGGFLVLGPADAGLRDFGAPHLLLASAVLLVASSIGYVGIADCPRIFSGGAFAGLAGIVAGLLGLVPASTPHGVAAIVLCVVVAVVPAVPVLSMRLGKLPVPALPERPEDVVADTPVPGSEAVYAGVVRSDEMLSGLLLGVAFVTVACDLVLLASGTADGLVLVGLVALAFVFRSRLFPSGRHRLPMLVAGLVGLTLLTLASAFALRGAIALYPVVSVLVVLGGLVAAGGMTYSRRRPSPYLGRVADVLDVVLVVSVVPVACAVLDLYGWARGLGG